MKQKTENKKQRTRLPGRACSYAELMAECKAQERQSRKLWFYVTPFGLAAVALGAVMIGTHAGNAFERVQNEGIMPKEMSLDELSMAIQKKNDLTAATNNAINDLTKKLQTASAQSAAIVAIKEKLTAASSTIVGNASSSNAK